MIAPQQGLDPKHSPHWQPELVQRVDELERTNGHQASFLARLSHELRNPLATLHQGLELLRLQSQEPGTVQTVQAMQRQLSYLMTLVDELLDAERIAQGKLALHKQPVILQSLLDGAMALSRPALAEREHSLQLELPQQPIRMDADPTRLTQVVVNLLVNAAKYTPAGGKVALRVQLLGNSVRLEVSDNGIGLGRDELPLIFDLYAQTASSRRMDAAGLGVGLALARQITTLHGGSLEAHSDGPGLGSTFVLILPLAGPSAPGSEPAMAPQIPTDAPGWRILVVDDNADAADTLAAALQCCGHQALAVHDGAAALMQARDWSPDVALIDLGMPGMDGYELARRMQQGTHPPALVAMTGWGSPSDRERCLAAGFAAHLVKPVPIDDILGLLAQLLTQPTEGAAAH